MNFEGTVICKKFIKRMQFLRLFHECDLYGCLIYDCETSKQLEHRKMEML